MRRKKEYYTVKETAEALGKSVGWIYQLINSNTLPVVKVGSINLIKADVLRAYKKNHNKKGVK